MIILCKSHPPSLPRHRLRFRGRAALSYLTIVVVMRLHMHQKLHYLIQEGVRNTPKALLKIIISFRYMHASTIEPR
jgi:hypothetical protein